MVGSEKIGEDGVDNYICILLENNLTRFPDRLEPGLHFTLEALSKKVVSFMPGECCERGHRGAKR